MVKLIIYNIVLLFICHNKRSSSSSSRTKVEIACRQMSPSIGYVRKASISRITRQRAVQSFVLKVAVGTFRKLFSFFCYIYKVRRQSSCFNGVVKTVLFNIWVGMFNFVCKTCKSIVHVAHACFF